MAPMRSSSGSISTSPSTWRRSSPMSVVHAAVGVEQGHGPAFGRVARAIGLEGKLTATVPGDEFKASVTPILDEVGPFPHAPLDWAGSRSGPKKQTARLLKVECQECGLVVRRTKKWIDEVGPAH